MLDTTHLREHIPPEIYKRAADYHRQGRVVTLTESGAGKWQATVSGTDDYLVRIQLNGSLLLKATCTCPHEADICKHIAATLMAISEEPTGGEPPAAPAKNTKRKDPAGKLPDLTRAVRQLTAGELQTLVLQFAAQNSEFKSYLTLHLLSRSNPSGREGYRQLIKQALKPFFRRGFIDYANSFNAMRPLLELADEAEVLLQKGAYRDAVDSSTALLAELPALVEHMDDSAGYLSDLSAAALGTLHGVLAADAPNPLKEELFAYALQERKKKKYEGWDWPGQFFELAIAAAANGEQYRQLLQEIEAALQQAETKEDDWRRDYERENGLNWKIAVLQKAGRADEAAAILQQHAEIPDFRRQLVLQHIEAGRLAEAVMLCEDALQRSLPQKTLWVEFLLAIARRRNDTAAFRRWSANLFFETNFSLESFRLYRSAFAEDDWPRHRKQLFGKVRKDERSRFYPYVLAELYVEEQLWNDLLALCLANPDLDLLQRYDSYLFDRFPAELLAAYENALVNYAAAKQGREHYIRIRKICSRLQKRLGGDELVAALVERFRGQYRQRRALMEELDKLVV